MKLEECVVGMCFTNGIHDWLCTDVGSRVVIAIRLGSIEVVTSTGDGSRSTRVLAEAEARAAGWFSGPPYAVVEEVFDETSICALTLLLDREVG